MVDNAFGDFFLTDVDDELLEEDDELITAPVVVPAAPAAAPPAPAAQQAATVPPVPTTPAPSAPVVPAVSTATPVASAAHTVAPVPAPLAEAEPVASREDRLAAALNKLMNESREISASALVSLDGFTMASALPEGMQEDRVGAMSAAILGLGERAAAELGRGSLSQVIIEGDGGYVMLISAGERAALTCLADTDAKLGLVLYDMRTAADAIALILG